MTATLTPQGTQYDYQGLQDLWTSNGGDPAKAPVAAAFALAESGGRSWAISPSNDWGIWQINGGGNSMLDPNANARRAITMSQNGQTWTPWCTAYSNPQRDCGHGGPSYLAAGAPVWRYLSGAAAKMAGLTANPPSGAASATPVVDLSGAQNASATSAPSAPIPGDTCYLKAPSVTIPLVNVKVGSGDCLFGTNNARALGGGLLIIAGAIVGIIGVKILVEGEVLNKVVGSVLPKPARQVANRAETFQQQRLNLQSRRVDLSEARFAENQKRSAPGATVNGKRVMGRVVDSEGKEF